MKTEEPTNKSLGEKDSCIFLAASACNKNPGKLWKEGSWKPPAAWSFTCAAAAGAGTNVEPHPDFLLLLLPPVNWQQQLHHLPRCEILSKKIERKFLRL